MAAAAAVRPMAATSITSGSPDEDDVPSPVDGSCDTCTEDVGVISTVGVDVVDSVGSGVADPVGVGVTVSVGVGVIGTVGDGVGVTGSAGVSRIVNVSVGESTTNDPV